MSDIGRHAKYHLTHRTDSGDTTIDYACMRDVLAYLRDMQLLEARTRTIYITVDDRTRKDSIAPKEYTQQGLRIQIPTEEEFLAELERERINELKKENKKCKKIKKAR